MKAAGPVQGHQVFATPLVRVVDTRCRAERGDLGLGDEGRADADQMLFTRSGVFVRHGAEGAVVADAGQVIFFNRGEAFRVSHPATGGDTATVVSFGPEIARDAVGEWDPASRNRATAFRLKHFTAGADLLMAQAVVRRHLRSGTVSQLEGEDFVLGLLRTSLAQAHGIRPGRRPAVGASTRKARRALAEATRVALAQEPDAGHSLGALARRVGSSPFHLTRIFKDEVGLTIHQYLLRLRMAHGLNALAEGTADITRLALDLGFSSHSHFTRYFGRTFGMSPSRFRRLASRDLLRRAQVVLRRVAGALDAAP